MIRWDIIDFTEVMEVKMIQQFQFADMERGPLMQIESRKLRWSVAILAFAIIGVATQTDAQAQTRAAYKKMRMEMVEDAVVAAGVTDARVIKSLRDTERHEFVPPRTSAIKRTSTRDCRSANNRQSARRLSSLT